VIAPSILGEYEIRPYEFEEGLTSRGGGKGRVGAATGRDILLRLSFSTKVVRLILSNSAALFLFQFDCCKAWSRS